MPFEAMQAMSVFMEIMARYANGATGTMTGTGNSIQHSPQQSWVPPSNTQSTSRGGMPDQGVPSPGLSSRPGKAKKGKSRANIQYNSGPRQIISDCYLPVVKNDKSFNNNNYYDSRTETRQEDQEDTSPEEEEDD
jgi:hypothetical protein